MVVYCGAMPENNSQNRFLLLKKKAVRACARAPYNSHTEPIFYRLKILKLDSIYHHQAVVFMFKLFARTLPSSLQNAVESFQPVCARNRRRPFIIPPRSNLNVVHSSCLYSGPSFVRSLPMEFFTFNNSFKLSKRLKEYIINAQHVNV